MLGLPATRVLKWEVDLQALILWVQSITTYTICVMVVRHILESIGGVQGGISNGEELYFRTAFKPTATVLQKQKTVDSEGQKPNSWGAADMTHAYFLVQFLLSKL